MSKPNNLRQWLKQWDAGEFNFTDMSFSLPHAQPPEPSADRGWERELVEGVERRELRLYQRLYPVLSALLCTVIIAFLLLTVAELPSFGRDSVPTANEVIKRYLEDGLAETGAVNAVAGMILDYRAFDTLGESHVLFTAVAAVLILLLSAKERPEPRALADITQADPILRATARVIVPAAIVYGIYVIFNGHLGPGGGFSGGAVIGGALILYAIAFGFERLERVLNLRVFRTVVALALCFYSAAKCYAFYCGANHLETIFRTGTPGAIFSAGLILPLNIAVGIVVACTMYGFYSLFQRGRI